MKRSGAGADNITRYIQKWDYYHRLQFLSDTITPRESTSNMETSKDSTPPLQESPPPSELEMPLGAETDDSNLFPETPMDALLPIEASPSTSSTNSTTAMSSVSTSGKRHHTTPPPPMWEELLLSAAKALEAPMNDPMYMFSQFVYMTLKHMTQHDQREVYTRISPP